MNKQRQLSLAIKLASERHYRQTDRSGSPYILHCLAVMDKLRVRYPKDVELHTIGVLHDIIEDTSVSEEELFMLGFSNRVLDGVLAMTKNDGEEYSGYIYRLISNLDAVKVKMADIEHNSDINRLKGLRDKDFERMAKYHRTYKKLEEVVENV